VIDGDPIKHHAQQSVRRIIQNEILSLLPADGAGGIAIAVHIDGRLMFFDEGLPI
jgi:hypothetical protein